MAVAALQLIQHQQQKEPKHEGQARQPFRHPLLMMVMGVIVHVAGVGSRKGVKALWDDNRQGGADEESAAQGRQGVELAVFDFEEEGERSGCGSERV
jgi:hypothetical protein